MNSSWVYLFALGLSVVGCASRMPFEPTPSDDWKREVSGSCQRAGEVLEANGCPEAHPKGTTWAEFCSKAQASRGAIALDVACIERATNVENVRKCHMRCR